MKKTTYNKITKAEKMIKASIELLKEASLETKNNEGTYDLIYYAGLLAELMSCDHGEAGMSVLVKKLALKVSE